MFFTPLVLIFHFKMHFKVSSAICFNLDQSKILSLGNELKAYFNKFIRALKQSIFRLCKAPKNQFTRIPDAKISYVSTLVI